MKNFESYSVDKDLWKTDRISTIYSAGSATVYMSLQVIR